MDFALGDVLSQALVYVFFPQNVFIFDSLDVFKNHLNTTFLLLVAAKILSIFLNVNVSKPLSTSLVFLFVSL